MGRTPKKLRTGFKREAKRWYLAALNEAGVDITSRERHQARQFARNSQEVFLETRASQLKAARRE